MRNSQRPSTFAAACAPVAIAAPIARTYVAGLTAVPAPLAKLLVPTWDMRRKAGTSKINNSMGIALTEGKAKSIFQDQSVSGQQVHTVDPIQGGSARGIPPRGRPV